MIVVTGATGQLGRAIVERLVRRVPKEQVGASARDPEKASGLAALGVRVRRGDFAEPESLASAFEGATQVLLVSSNARATGGDTLAQHRSAIDAAKRAGVRRVLYTSHMSASATSAFGPARDHAATEEMLRGAGVAWTSLRNGFYASSGLAMMGDAPKTGALEAPLDGATSWTAHANLAEAAAVILADGAAREGRFEGPTPPLVAPDALDLAALASVVSEILGKPIRRTILSDEDLVARVEARGAPRVIAEIALGYFRAARAGEFAASDGTLEQLIGRRPTPIGAVLRELLSTR